MHCDRTRELLGAFRDGELSGDDRRAVSAHLGACRDCSEQAADDARIASILRGSDRIAAPPTLLRTVRDRLEQIDAEDAETPPATGRRSQAHLDLASLGNQAAVLAAACLMTALVTWWLTLSSVVSDRIAREVISAHIRSLLQGSAVQVSSSDQHTVKPWFAGRTDFSPDIKNLADEGFPLVGGRLDYVADRRVAVAVYMRRLHVVNVFMWPSASAAESAPHLAIRNGYNLLSWTRNGITYWAASDLNAGELAELHRLL